MIEKKLKVPNILSSKYFLYLEGIAMPNARCKPRDLPNVVRTEVLKKHLGAVSRSPEMSEMPPDQILLVLILIRYLQFADTK